MVQITQKGNNFALVFSVDEAKHLGMNSTCEYELSKARDGIWVVVEQGPLEKKAPLQIDETEQKIIGMLRTLAPRDRMEEWFEKKLSKVEAEKFREMLKDGRVIKFKSSEVFRKSLYTLPKKSETKTSSAKNFENKEKPIEEFSLEKDGFLVVRNELRAKALSEELREKIKSGEIKGTRSFSGEFFIIQSPLLISSQTKALEALKESSSTTLQQLCQKIDLTPTLIRIAMEFLKEEGQIIEKKKETYEYIE